MYHVPNIWMRRKDLIESGLIRHIGIVELGTLPAYQFYAVDGFFRGI